MDSNNHPGPAVALRLDGVGHAYLGRTVLDRVDLAVSAGEVVALVGPSGCGKSTLAHVAAGIVQPLRGRVTRNYRRHGMVFQEPRLLPWARARDNIAYSLRFMALTRAERRERAEAAARRVALEPADLGKFPVELSGGMRQRVAIARALAVEPDFLYFDEPFTALDVALKRRMQDVVIVAAHSLRVPALFITHDLVEATRIARRIAVMDVHGRGVAGERIIAGDPGGRAEEEIHRTVSAFLRDDPLFRHIDDVDERRVA